MKKSSTLGLACTCIFSLLYVTQASALPMTFDDGGVHAIDYAVTDGVDLDNGTTLNVETGAYITSPLVGLGFMRRKLKA